VPEAWLEPASGGSHFRFRGVLLSDAIATLNLGHLLTKLPAR
jgi:hypothetical protein